MRKLGIGLVCVLAIVRGFGNAFAQMPSAKGSAAITGLTLIEATAETHSWDPVLWTYIKVPQQKELIFDVALQCGLFTLTHVKSKHGKSDTSTATVSIDVRVKLEPVIDVNPDGTPILGNPFYAHPGGENEGVTYAKRTQDLMAKFGGIIESCQDINQDGVIDFLTECVVTEEELRLTLDTLNANAFNFIAPNLDQGEYEVTVEAQITTDTDSQAGSAEAWGLVGMGSMVVDEVRFIKGDSGVSP
jgi:hypothetical protein